jgi:hypothetical protein
VNEEAMTRVGSQRHRKKKSEKVSDRLHIRAGLTPLPIEEKDDVHQCRQRLYGKEKKAITFNMNQPLFFGC